jgi:hypothetical protein
MARPKRFELLTPRFVVLVHCFHTVMSGSGLGGSEVRMGL